MTFRFCDGCDSYAATADISAKFPGATSATYSSTAGRFGGGAITSTAPYNLALNRGVSVPSGAKLRIAFSMKAGTGWSLLGVNTVYPLLAVNGSHIAGITTAGQLAITNLNSATIALTSTKIVVDNAYHWVEIEYYLNGASGTTQLYIDGVSQGFATASLGSAVTVTSVKFSGAYNTGGTHYYDDIIIWDDQGASFNTFPLGPRRISTLVPNADGDLTQFTPKTGTSHFAMVNGGYTSTNYVSDGGTGNVDLYKFPTLSYTPTSINAVVGNYYGQNTGAGSTNLIPKVKTSGTTASGTTLTMTVGVNSLLQSAFVTDAGGSAWAASAVNAMQIGMGD
jgi:hypothetical protein